MAKRKVIEQTPEKTVTQITVTEHPQPKNLKQRRETARARRMLARARARANPEALNKKQRGHKARLQRQKDGKWEGRFERLMDAQ
jgi:hypothetical protein